MKTPRRPKPFIHKSSSQVVAKIAGKFTYHGLHTDPESWTRARAAIAKHLAGVPVAAARPASSRDEKVAGPTVLDVAAKVWALFEKQYGESTELERCTYVLALLKTFYVETPILAFGPNALRHCQQTMAGDNGWIDSEGKKQGWLDSEGKEHAALSRKETNRRVGLIRRYIAKAVAHQLIFQGVEQTPEMTLQAAALHQSLKYVEPLREGGDAKESEETTAVPAKDVEAVLPYLNPTVAAMVKVHLATGMRTGELLIMRPRDIQRAGERWVYVPQTHKNQWRQREGRESKKRHARRVPLGPKARAALAPLLLGVPDDAYVFSPKRERERRYAELRSKRQSPVQPSQVDRKKEDAERLPTDKYSTSSYARAIARACDAAKVEPFRPYALRYSKIQEIEDADGPAGAAAIAGHTHLRTTEGYTKDRHRRAERLAEELG